VVVERGDRRAPTITMTALSGTTNKSEAGPVDMCTAVGLMEGFAHPRRANRFAAGGLIAVPWPFCS
jgi:hypothetical protein